MPKTTNGGYGTGPLVCIKIYPNVYMKTLVFELTPSPETIRNFGFRPEPWRLHRARHIRDWITKDHNINDSTRFSFIIFYINQFHIHCIN